MESSGRRRRPGIYWILLPPDRLPHVQVDFCTANSGRADGVCRFGLADLSVKSAGKLSVPLQSGLRPPRGSIRVPVAGRDGCERSEMARESNFGELAEHSRRREAACRIPAAFMPALQTRRR